MKYDETNGPISARWSLEVGLCPSPTSSQMHFPLPKQTEILCKMLATSSYRIPDEDDGDEITLHHSKQKTYLVTTPPICTALLIVSENGTHLVHRLVWPPTGQQTHMLYQLVRTAGGIPGPLAVLFDRTPVEVAEEKVPTLRVAPTRAARAREPSMVAERYRRVCYYDGRGRRGDGERTQAALAQECKICENRKGK